MFANRILFVLVALAWLCPMALASPMDHAWSKRFGVPGSQPESAGLAVDSMGNTVIAGRFFTSVDFGGGELTSLGVTDIYVAKFDPNGFHLWSKRFGDALQDDATSVDVDAAGNIVVVGNFHGTVNFGGGLLTGAGGLNAFVVKFDPDGNHVWSQAFTSTTSATLTAVAVDDVGNAHVTGDFQDNLDVGFGPLPSAGGSDGYVLKFGPAGNLVWGHEFGDASDEQTASIAVSDAGDVVITGRFEGTVSIAGGGVLTDAGQFDVYLAAFDAAGNHSWSQRFGDANPQQSSDVAIDSEGNIVLTGDLQSSMDFGGGLLIADGGTDVFLAKFDASGNHLWSQDYGAESSQFVDSIAVDDRGAIALAGQNFGTVNFGGGVFTSAGNRDKFLVRFDADGSHLWSQTYHASLNNVYPSGVAFDGGGNLVTVGHFQGDMYLGGGLLSFTGSFNVYLAKFWRATPDIVAVRDVPGDQGGLVNVAWDASGIDTSFEHLITEYTVWRAIDPSLATAMKSAGASIIESPATIPDKGSVNIVRTEHSKSGTYYWQLMSTIPAFFLYGYSEPVPTLFNASDAGMEPHHFQVIAHTSDPFTFYASEPDTGSSIDNLSPDPPQNIIVDWVWGDPQLGDLPILSWQPNTEEDLRDYRVYRSSDPNFIAGPSNLVSIVIAPEFADTTGVLGQYYRVTAVDLSGNESEVAAPASVTSTGELPTHMFSLSQNSPNPFNPSTTISYVLPEPEMAELVIYDLAGRSVRRLVSRALPAGPQQVEWNGRDDAGDPVATGVYLYQLRAGSLVESRRLVLLK